METLSPRQADKQCVQRMIGGDISGYEELFKKYYAPLCGFALKYVKDRDASEDIVADVFYKLWNKREALNADVEIKPYLYVATKNTSLNYLKTSNRNVDVEEETFNNYFVEHRNPYDDMEFDELKAKLHETISSLPPKCQEVFRLSRFEDMSYKEIAEEMGISVKTVENQMGKALKKLREGLGRYLKLILFLFSINFFEF